MLSYEQRMKLYQQLNPNELTPDQFLKLRQEVKKANTISDEYLDFKLWCEGLPSRQEQFADYIVRKLRNNLKAKILEIGCGRTGRLSRILSEKGFIMTGMDPKVEETDQTSNIELIKKKFDYRTCDITIYDYVIAQEPCEATEHIVRACANQKVPFIMSLCGTPHRLISGEEPKDVYEWHNYLLSIDKENTNLHYLKLNPFATDSILKSNKF